MLFEDFPTDILFYLLGCLELDDALILLSTCTRLRKLSHNRSLWISILQEIQSNGSRPLACPIQQDFSELSLSDLQKIVHHTVRLEKNWSRENPRIIGAVSTTQFDEVYGPFCIFSTIPGTNILVLHSAGELFCYDLSTTTSLPPLFIGEGPCWAQFDERGKQFIGVADVKENVFSLDVLCIEYGPGTPPTLRNVYQRIEPAPHMRYCRDIFMNAAIVGMIYNDATSNQLCLLAINIHTSESITVPLPGLSDTFRPFLWHFLTLYCLLQGNYVYISTQTESCTCHIFRCDISAPWDDCNTDGRLSPPVTIGPLEPTLRGHPRFRPKPCKLLQPVGLTALYTDTHSNPITTTILFQPDIFTSFGSQTEILRLDLRGDLNPPHPYSLSVDSGNYLLLCTEPKDDHDDDDDEIEEDVDPQPEFYLVHFVKGPPASIAARQLKMPDFIEEELAHDRIHSMVVDDHLGVVYLTREGGYISAVPFA